MKTFKRKINILPKHLKSKKLWQSFIQQELQTNNLKNLVHLSEKMEDILNNLEIKDFYFNKKILFLKLTDHNTTNLYIRKLPGDKIVTVFESLLSYYTINDKDAMEEIARRAPVYMLYYLEKHRHTKIKKQLNCSTL